MSVSALLARKTAGEVVLDITPRHQVLNLSEHSKGLSSICLAFNYGPRYESNSLNGISHIIRACLGLSTYSKTAFKIQTLLQPKNISIDVIQHKDLTAYSIMSAQHNIYFAFETFMDMIFNPAFLHHEVREVLQNGVPNYDSIACKSQIQNHFNEMIHRASFGYSSLGLSSIYEPNDSLLTENIEPFYFGRYLLSKSLTLTHGISNLAARDISNRLMELSSEMPFPGQNETPSDAFHDGNFLSQNFSDCGYLHCAYSFCFRHNDPDTRLQELVGLRVLAGFFGSCWQNFNFSSYHRESQGTLSKFIESELGSALGIKIKPELFEYNDFTLFTLKLHIYQLERSVSFLRVIQKFLVNMPEIDQKVKKILIKKFELENEAIKECGRDFAEFLVKPAMLCGKGALNMTQLAKKITIKDLNAYLSVIKTQKASVAALGDCKYLKNIF